MQASRAAVAILGASLVVSMIAGVNPAFGQPTGDANVSRAISKWSKSTQRARLQLTAEGILVQREAEQSAYGRLSYVRCHRRALPGPRACIGTSAIKPLNGTFTVEQDLSGASLEMKLRGRQHLVQWTASEDGTFEPEIRSVERGRADVERDAAASGEFFGRSVALTQLKAAAIEQVVDVVPQDAPVPFPFEIPDPFSARSLASSSSCWYFKPSEKGFARKMNQARVAAGLRKLRLDPELSKVSRVHTAEMFKADLLHHATSAQLTRRVTNWSVLGENVGVGGTVASLHDAFMNSPAHKANILLTGYNHVGVGVAKKNGRMWVTVTFAKSPNPGTSLKMPRC